MNKTEVEIRAEVEELRKRVLWLEGALELLTAKLQELGAARSALRAAPNLWELAELGRELAKEMKDSKGDF